MRRTTLCGLFRTGRCALTVRHWPSVTPVYSSFLRHAEAAAHKYGLKTVDILVELGRRKMVGGQEDMIIDVALDLRGCLARAAAPEPVVR